MICGANIAPVQRSRQAEKSCCILPEVQRAVAEYATFLGEIKPKTRLSRDHWLGGLGVLLFFEIIPPFHDMSIDGPLALALWGVGAALGVVSLSLKGRSLTLGISIHRQRQRSEQKHQVHDKLAHSNFAWH
jgi:hypothetical protein